MTRADVLLTELLSIYLGNRDKLSFEPSQEEWMKLLEDGKQQGVSGFLFSALHKLHDKHISEGQSASVSPTLIANLAARSEVLKANHEKYKDALSTLSVLYTEKGYRMFVLKGYGCALNYPDPELRPCGDIDIYLKKIVEEKAQEGTGSVTLEASKYILSEDSDSCHHEQFRFKGYLVENHRTILELHKHRSNKALNELLTSLLDEETRTTRIGDTEIYLPSSRFYAIHLLRHMANDFATSRTTLRHVLDWATYVTHNDVSWDYVFQVSQQFHLYHFLNVVNGICVHYLGYQNELFPTGELDEGLMEKVYGEIIHGDVSVFNEKPSRQMPFFTFIKYCFRRTSHFWHDRWKYKLVFGESLWLSFYYSSKNRLKMQFRYFD